MAVKIAGTYIHKGPSCQEHDVDGDNSAVNSKHTLKE